jgi:phage terminase large subunit GpA-like protein
MSWSPCDDAFKRCREAKGQPIRSGIRGKGDGVPAFKRELLFDRIKRKKPKDSHVDHTPRIYLPRPKDVNPQLVKELLNEKLVFKKNKSGYEDWQWVKSGENDYLDCLKYALALWMIMEPTLEEGET